MPIRETSKIVQISGRRWKIEKFDALTGGFIASKMISKLTNVVIGVMSGNLKEPAIIGMAIANEIGSFSRQEFSEIQGICLEVVKEVTGVDGKDIESPIRMPDGRWLIKELENDGLLIMGLVTHVIVFNLTGFFDVSALKELKDSFQGLTLFDAQT
jgi:hypothetical protein